MCLAPAALAGCYTYTYAPTTPAPGIRMALELNDVGRVAMADHVGQGTARVEGWLVSLADSQYTLRVERTITLYGSTVPWSGEQVVIRTAWVGLAREKRFSAQRTFVLAGAVTAGFIGFLATRGLLGNGNGGGDLPGTGGTNGN